MGLREQIESHDDLERSKVHVPEWGMDVWIRLFTGSERGAWERSMVKEVDGEFVRDMDQIGQSAVRLAALCLCDESGARIFPTESDGMEVLGRKSAKAIERIAQAASELNALGAGAVTEAIEDLEETPANDTR